MRCIHATDRTLQDSANPGNQAGRALQVIAVLGTEHFPQAEPRADRLGQPARRRRGGRAKNHSPQRARRTQRGRWPQPKTSFSVSSLPLQAPTQSTQRRSVISVFHLYFGTESTEKNLRRSRRNSVLVTRRVRRRSSRLRHRRAASLSSASYLIFASIHAEADSTATGLFMYTPNSCT